MAPETQHGTWLERFYDPWKEWLEPPKHMTLARPFLMWCGEDVKIERTVYVFKMTLFLFISLTELIPFHSFLA